MYRIFSKITFLIFLTFLCNACEKKNNNSQILIVLTSPDNPPFEFKDTAKGGDQVIGFDMDIIQEVAKRLNKTVKINEIDFSGIIPSIQASRADLAIATLTRTKEREENVAFSVPYYQYKLALVIREDDSPLIKSEKNLENKKLGVQQGSSHEVTAKKWAGNIHGLTVVSLSKIGELIQELKNKRIDAVLTEDFTARNIIGSTPHLAFIKLSFPGETLHIALPKNAPLLAPINQALREMKKEGKIDQLISHWFKSKP